MRTTNNESYSDIASSYELWEEYIDPIGIDTLEDFNKATLDYKIAFIVKCFGPERGANN